VDWSFLFKTFYEKVRLKVAVRDPTKIPYERFYVMAKKLYLVLITVEGYDSEDGESSRPDEDGDDHSKGDDEISDDDADDLDDIPKDMDTERGAGGD
jgi:hypothetical protein